ncbi:hypothetical protein JZU54_07855 [bacterium]|nr:hypothetical protein [bacterium]
MMYANRPPLILAFPPHQRKSNKWMENEGGDLIWFIIINKLILIEQDIARFVFKPQVRTQDEA